MSQPEAIDFSPLDPRRDPVAWERLVARVLRDSEPEAAPTRPSVPAIVLPLVRELPSP
jgi:hypothetical protein